MSCDEISYAAALRNRSHAREVTTLTPPSQECSRASTLRAGDNSDFISILLFGYFDGSRPILLESRLTVR
jgi:hypothetical protein